MKTRITRMAALGMALAMLTAVTACSFAASSRSSSSPCRSSSRSSRRAPGPGPYDRGPEAPMVSEPTADAFQEEISATTVLQLRANATAESFQREVGAIAGRHGVIDWQGDRRTFVAIGRGLKRAGVNYEAVPYLPFLQGLKNLRHYDAIGQGFGQ